ncbi:hypothetical protein BDK51DRAFT_32042 [Blyttiomyces helicus]|uniref:Uncharacterized protein n=1 Tax=Blyttiomyces helicus TaxID=388810 RepID=A0A4P9WNU9_9FUNG|nr:hypothetical protein BDK51DRAFT_32042 [Blyttiomyces helicus]|eukprot:RKO94819.1 hypothetical protein BDK51DRAFT_32042 [Blyttiomyces helicus]
MDLPALESVYSWGRGAKDGSFARKEGGGVELAGVLRQEYLTKDTIGNVPAKGAWKSVLETLKELVEDDVDSGRIMLATLEVVTKCLVNKCATFDKNLKAYIQKGDAMGDAVDDNGLAEYHHLIFIQSDEYTPHLQKINISCAGAVAQDEYVFGAEKESKVEQEDRKNHTAEVDDEDGIFDNEIEGGTIVLDKRAVNKQDPHQEYNWAEKASAKVSAKDQLTLQSTPPNPQIEVDQHSAW